MAEQPKLYLISKVYLNSNLTKNLSLEIRLSSQPAFIKT